MASRLRQFSRPACEPPLERAKRRALGVYYTPPEIVRLVVDRTLQADPQRVLDFACGAGEFLVEALRYLRQRTNAAAARRSIFGIDIDAAAVRAARERVIEIDPHCPRSNLVVGDALQNDCFPAGSFDAIIGNPPYVNIRELAKSLSREQRVWLRERFSTARGNFDLYTLFIERAIELLKPGGRCGLIVPNKWATLDYARPCRKLLLAHTTIEHIIDLSSSGAFAAANVYPHVLVFCKRSPRASHAIQVSTDQAPSRAIKQRSLSADAIQLGPVLEVESRISSSPLGDVASLACGTAGYSASKIAQRLIDRPNSPLRSEKVPDFITSGNIDRFAIRLGHVRFLNQHYRRPRLALDCPELTAAKRRLFAEPKIVIAGMSRRLEAAWVERGLALGVQVFAASQFNVDPFYLLALLNSKLLSYLFATRFAGKRLAGGYLAINKGQLARLPIAVPNERASQRKIDRLAVLAAEWTLFQDEEIDQLVYRLYRLSPEEIRGVEAHFARPRAIAA